MSAGPEPQTISALFGEVLEHLTKLMRKEVDLAKGEVAQGLERAALGIGLVVGAVVLALVALNILAAAAVAGLVSLGLASGWASLIVGGSLALIASGLALKGINDLKLKNLKPDRAMDNVKRDAATLTEVFHDKAV